MNNERKTLVNRVYKIQEIPELELKESEMVVV